MSRSRRLLSMATVTTAGLVAAALALSQGVAAAGPAAADGGPVGGAPVAAIGAIPAQVASHAAAFVGHVRAAQPIRVTFGIKPRNLAAAEQFNTQVQDRSSPLYHHYLTAAQWNKRFAPTAAAERSVVEWARANHLTITQRYPNRLLVDVTGTAAALESAMHLTINNYALQGRTLFSNDRAPQLPSSISSVVSSVDGLNNFAQLQSAGTNTAHFKRYSAGPVAQLHVSAHANGSKAKLRAALAARHGNIANITGGAYDPTDIYSSQAYDENALHAQSSCCNPQHLAGGSPAATSIAIATAGAHQLSDMQGFQARYPYLAYYYNEIYVDGTPTCCDGEGQMDLEWSTAMSNSFGSYLDTAHVWLYSGVNAQFSTFNDIYNKILTDGHAKIVSSSWGCAEIYCTSDATMNTEHNIFVAMIGQGYTLLNASGDRGGFADCSHRSVSFPASDPDWIGVSATNLELNSSGQYVSETAWPANSAGCASNGGGGGGGCSVKYSAPNWQTGTSSFCGTMRAVPDVSLNGDWFNSPQNLYVNGAWQGNGGTSIAAPEFAGFIAQENSYLLTLGNICGLGSGNSPCAPLGQGGYNLYHAAQSHGAGGLNPFYDITSGCTTNNAGSGYCGITGYDRATGWGSINMLQLAWAMSYWTVAEASAPTVTLSGPATNTWLPSGSISWSVADNGGAYSPSGVAGWTAGWDADPGNPTSHSTPGSGDSFYTGPASAHGSTSGSTSLLTGCHRLYVRAWDNIGESAVNSYGPVCYDPIAPSTPVGGLATFVKGTQVNNGKVPVRISWGASTDSLSGVKQYNVSQSTDGGAFVSVGSTTNPYLDVALAPGHVYQFEMTAQDNAGNVSSLDVAAKFHVQLANERYSAVSYTGTWAGQNIASALSGRVEYTTQHHATAKFSFSGARVAWVADVGPARGSAGVKLDGGTAVTVSEHAATAAPRTLIYTSMFNGGTHHLVIDNQATAGHPRIDIDAFVVLAPA